MNDFWRMVWETQSKVVVCLTDIVERGVVSTGRAERGVGWGELRHGVPSTVRCN